MMSRSGREIFFQRKSESYSSCIHSREDHEHQCRTLCTCLCACDCRAHRDGVTENKTMSQVKQSHTVIWTHQVQISQVSSHWGGSDSARRERERVCARERARTTVSKGSAKKRGESKTERTRHTARASR